MMHRVPDDFHSVRNVYGDDTGQQRDLFGALVRELGNDYDVERELASGGMGRVFAASQRALQRRVVIKVLADRNREVDLRRFRQEILLSAGLQHPHIVPVHAAGDVDGLPYFVMPFVEGQSLREVLQSGALMSSGEILRILRDIASALRYAHSRGVVHRDLKPENVMLSAGSVVVLDFGVAKALAVGATSSSRATTGVGYTVGTPGYMAPEQAAGDPLLDHRADIYSLGVLAFELCTGTPVFTGSPSEVLRAHFAEAPPDLSAVRPGLPVHLVATVRQCLEKDPANRPRDAAELLDLLDGVRPATSLPIVESVKRPRQPRPWQSMAVVIPGAYTIIAIAVVLYLLRLAEANRIRDGIVAAGLIGALLGLPIAMASGILLRLVGGERGGYR